MAEAVDVDTELEASTHSSLVQRCPPERSQSHASTWMFSETGTLPSQYIPRAIDKTIASIASTLEAIESSRGCTQGIHAHSAFLEEVCTMCLPIILNPKALPIVERLICAQHHCSKLSNDFLSKVTSLQKGEGEYSATPKLNLSYDGRVRLWAIFLPSFQEELFDMIKAVSPVGLSDSEMEYIISSRSLPRACLEHYHLLLYSEEVLRVLFINADASPRIKQFISCFNCQLFQAHKEQLQSSSSSSASVCPQFDMEKWQRQLAEHKQMHSKQ